MALSNRYSGHEQRHLPLTEKRLHIYFKENSVRKLLSKFKGDPIVGSKVMALSNRYCGVERRDLLLTE
jgi:hypothetical protein